MTRDALLKEIHRFLDHLTVSSIMVPRSEVILIDAGSSLSEIVEIIRREGYSRYPVYENHVDNIIGVLYAKDLLGQMLFEQVSLKKILRKPIFVSENKKVSQLLAEFRQTHIHLGIVVDEFGTMVGIVSLEDILEELVGEIEDEFDTKTAEKEYEILPDESVILSPKMSIAKFNDIFKQKVPDDTFETLGGFLMGEKGYVPSVGETVEYNGVVFTVLDVKGSRIQKIGMKKK
ncbi:MAG: hemolysin family protein [Brevinematales bacterium]|nr:hemolysin family protein [Brevinematales bacterium]